MLNDLSELGVVFVWGRFYRVLLNTGFLHMLLLNWIHFLIDDKFLLDLHTPKVQQDNSFIVRFVCGSSKSKKKTRVISIRADAFYVFT